MVESSDEGFVVETNGMILAGEEDPMVDHPPHYMSKSGLEVIDVIEAFTEDLTGPEATHTGNILKYICRWKHKNGLEDLKKARWYLDRLIRKVEEDEDGYSCTVR